MHPVLIRIGSIQILTFDFAMLIALVVSLCLGVYRGRHAGIQAKTVIALITLASMAGVLGSKAWFIIPHWHEFTLKWKFDLTMLLAGSGAFGAIPAVMVAATAYLKLKKLNVLRVFDRILCPCWALSIFIGRIGCFFNGCCFGSPTNGKLGVIFPPSCSAGYVFPDIALHPTQLYMAAKGVLMFATILLIAPYKKFDGAILSLTLMLYGVSRFTVDFFRYYDDTMTFMKAGDVRITLTQCLSIVLFVVGALLMALLYSNDKSSHNRVSSKDY